MQPLPFDLGQRVKVQVNRKADRWLPAVVTRIWPEQPRRLQVTVTATSAGRPMVVLADRVRAA